MVAQKVNQELTNKAVEALLKHHEKVNADKKDLLGTDLPVQVQLGLEVAPKNPSIKPMRIKIPFSYNKVDDKASDLDEPEVCLIVKDGAKGTIKALFEKVELKCVKKVIELDALRKKHGTFQQRRDLLHTYSHFMADDRIIPMLTKTLGRDFIKYKKQPIPVRTTRLGSLPFQILDSLKCTHMVLSQGTCITIQAGVTNMPAKQLVENVLAVAEMSVKNVPKEWANIRSITIKTSKSASLPIYTKTPEELQEIAKQAGIQPIYVEKEEKRVPEKKRKTEKSPLLRALKKQKESEKKDTEKPEVEDQDEPKTKRVKKSDEKSEKTTKAKDKSNEKSPTETKSEKKKQKNKKAAVEDDVVEKSSGKTEKKQKKAASETVKEKDQAKKKQKSKETTESTPAEVVKQIPTEKKSKQASAEESTEKAKKKKSGEDVKKDFILSDKYSGSKKGYVFRKGASGLGYYIDNPPKVDKMAIEAILRMASQKSRGASKGRSGSKKRGGRR